MVGDAARCFLSRQFRAHAKSDLIFTVKGCENYLSTEEARHTPRKAHSFQPAFKKDLTMKHKTEREDRPQLY